MSDKKAKIPIFKTRFRKLTDDCGGVTEMSNRLGISRPTVNFWYNGERTPDAENLTIIAKEFGKSVDWLLGLVDDENQTNDTTVKAVSAYTGLSNVAIKRLHNTIERKRDERNNGWKSVQECELRALNTLLEEDYSFLSLAYDYLFRTFDHFGIIQTDENGEDKEAFDKDVAVYGKFNDGDQCSESGFFLSTDGVEDLILLRIEQGLRNIRARHIKNGGADNGKHKQS